MSGVRIAMARKRTLLLVHRTTRLSLKVPDEVHLPPQMYSCISIEEMPKEKMRARASETTRSGVSSCSCSCVQLPLLPVHLPSASGPL